jgi:acetolactate synthase-1/2/3 large subunit
MATRGPGAANALAGLHVGRQDSTPMIAFIGQVARHMRGREAFQEIDVRRMFGEVAKWVEEVDRADRVPEFVSRAFHEATAGRPGPVVLSLPEDMLRETTDAANAAPWVQVETHPGPTQMAQLQKMLWAAKRPFVILGGSRWSEAAVAGMRRFAERFDIPVGCSFRRQMLFDHDHPNYAGDVGIAPNPELARRVTEADVLLLIGGRMSEMPSSGYTLIDIPEPGRRSSVHPAPREPAASTGRRSPSTPARPPSSLPWKACSRRTTGLPGARSERRAPPTLPGRRW